MTTQRKTMQRWWACLPVVAVLAGLIGVPPVGRTVSGAEPRPMERITLDDSGEKFMLEPSGMPFEPWGFNFVGVFGRIVEEYWEDDWQSIEKDFREMRSLGANCVRLHLQVGTYMAAPDRVKQAELDRLARMLDLAQETGLYLDLTGLNCFRLDAIPPWYDKLSEVDRWQVQARFWEAIAKTCAGHPAVFCYDLMNEPVVGEAKEGEHPWLLGELEGFYFVQRISNQPKGRSREEIVATWVETMVDAIRRHDPDTLVTVGVIPWALPFPGAKPTFYCPQAAKHLDFVSAHFYPGAGEVEKALKALKVYDLGKPLVVEETFPLSCSLEEFEQFIDQGEPPADGWISHYFGHTIEEHQAGAQPGGAPVARFFEYWQEESARRKARPSLRIEIDTDSDLGTLYDFWNVFPVTVQAPFKDEGQYEQLRQLYPGAKTINCVRFLGGIDLTKDDYFRGVDEEGQAVCDFTEAVALLTGIRKCGYTPWIVLDNVPAAMSAEPTKNKYGNTEPPADFDVWSSYVRQLVQALVDHFGRDEVGSWRFRVGTEPDLLPGHWSGTKEEYLTHYDYTVAAALSVLPDADIGPGNILDPVKHKNRGWGLEIIDHCATGINHATGEVGTPMRFFASSYYTSVGVPNDRFEEVVETMRARLAEYPQFADVPVEIHEFGILTDHGKLLAGDGTEFGGSWMAHMARKIYDLNVGRVYQWHWNTTKGGGMAIPVTHVLGMLKAMVGGRRLAATLSRESETDDVACLACEKDGGLDLLVYRHRADRPDGEPTTVRVTLQGDAIESGTWQVVGGALIDGDHSVFMNERAADIERAHEALGDDASPLAAAIYVMARHQEKYRQLSELSPLAPLPELVVEDADSVSFDAQLSGHTVIHLRLESRD